MSVLWMTGLFYRLIGGRVLGVPPCELLGSHGEKLWRKTLFSGSTKHRLTTFECKGLYLLQPFSLSLPPLPFNHSTKHFLLNDKFFDFLSFKPLFIKKVWAITSDADSLVAHFVGQFSDGPFYASGF